MPTPPRPRPTGRRPGDSGTRDAILDAALALFADRGYDGASLRAIAAAAGVDPGLIRHFFGDKEGLFTTAVADRMQMGDLLARAAAADPATVGRDMTEAYLTLWEDPGTGPIVRALVRSATTSAAAAHMLRQMIGARMQDATGGDTERTRRIALAAAHLLGIAVTRYVVEVGPMVDIPRDELVDRVAPAVQRYLTGE